LQHGGAPYRRDSCGCGIIIEEATRNYFPNAVRIMLLAVNLRALDATLYQVMLKNGSDRGSQ
jgi:hypothetical protein